MSELPIINAVFLTKDGHGKKLDKSQLKSQLPLEDEGVCWVQLNSINAAAKKWLLAVAKLNEVVIEALCAEATRPRAIEQEDGLLLTLRGVNLNPGSDPEDMIALRLWVTSKLIISVARRRLFSIENIHQDLSVGVGPKNSAEFLVEIASNLMERTATVVTDLDEKIDEIEDQIELTKPQILRPQLADLRRRIIIFRRYLAPQRDALLRLNTDKLSWLDAVSRIQLREISDSTIRLLEDLDAVKERTAVAYEALMGFIQERLNSRMYLLSIVAVIFMPLSFLTGLLGINVGGIPGSSFHLAFWLVCAILLGIFVLQVFYLRWRHWL